MERSVQNISEKKIYLLDKIWKVYLKAKIKRKFDTAKKKCKKFGFLHFGVNYKCGLLYPTN